MLEKILLRNAHKFHICYVKQGDLFIYSNVCVCVSVKCMRVFVVMSYKRLV